MRIGLGVSLVSHAALLAVGLMSLGGAEKFDPTEIEAIPIELVPIESVSNIRFGSLDSNVIETETPSAVDSEVEAQIAEPTGNTEENQAKPEDTEIVTPAPTQESAPEPVPEPDPIPVERVPEPPQPEPTPEPEPVVEPTPPAPEPEPVVEPTPEPVQPTAEPVEPVVATQDVNAEPEVQAPKPPATNTAVEKARVAYAESVKKQAAKRASEEAKKADKISDIINKEDTRGATTGSGGKKTAGKTTGTAARLTQSEKAALAAQMRKCWNPPISALEMDGLTVRLLVDLNRDGSVGGTPQVLDISIRGKVGEATAGAAQRAVRRCGPYTLASGKYEDWRQVDVTFDPRDLR
ncbi:hypothetical protein [Maritalea sp.]|uniref:cell envelope integrity protein TolA n=1 Tax=Maritalea sp. TaxID=2003361 RepID=UPI003EF448AC